MDKFWNGTNLERAAPDYRAVASGKPAAVVRLRPGPRILTEWRNRGAIRWGNTAAKETLKIIHAIRAIRGLNALVKHEEITPEVIGAAMTVLNELKPGLDEKLYENALVLELSQRGHGIEQQREFTVHYRGHYMGKLVPDLIVDRSVFVDSKVVTAFHENHIAQMLGYLNITDLELALLLNFKEKKLTWKRVVTGPRR